METPDVVATDETDEDTPAPDLAKTLLNAAVTVMAGVGMYVVVGRIKNRIVERMAKKIEDADNSVE